MQRRSLNLGVLATALGMPAYLRQASAQSKEVITFAAAVFSEAGRAERTRAWVETFNRSQAGIEVQPVALTFSTLANTVFTQMGGGGGPDLVRFDHLDYYAAVAANRILPFNGIIKEEEYRFRAPDRFLKTDAARHGVVFDTTGYGLLYNPALLANGTPPTRFEDFLSASKSATREGNFGYAFRATMAERAGFWQDVCNFVYGFGGRWSTDDGKLTINSDKVAEGIAAYKAVYDSGTIPKGADAATYRRMFWEGKVAMEVDNGGVAAIFRQQAPSLRFGVAQSPFPTRAQGLILTALTINANTKYRDAAATFVRWVLQPENQKALQDALGTSAGVQVERTVEELTRQPWLEYYDAQTAYSVSQLVTGQEVKTPEIQQIILDQVLRVLQQGTEPKAAMADAQRLVERRIIRP